MILSLIFTALSIAAIGANIRRKYWGSALILTVCLISALWLFAHAPDTQRNPEQMRIAERSVRI